MTEVLLSIGGGSGGAIKAPQRLETVDNGTHPAVAADGLAAKYASSGLLLSKGKPQLMPFQQASTTLSLKNHVAVSEGSSRISV